jgi:type VI secretion system protein ImpH
MEHAVNSLNDFRGVVRSLEQLARQQTRMQPRLGYAKRPAEENVRFSQPPHLFFPPSDIAQVADGTRPGVDADIAVYFLGLLGPSGPMPLEFTNYILQRSRTARDTTWEKFLDIIHHRFLTLFYRASVQNEQAVSFDRADSDPISSIVKALAGFTPLLRLEDRRDMLALSFARHYGSATKTREGLEDILRRFLNLPLEVHDFIPAQYEIPEDARAVLGQRSNSTLGVDMQIGRHYTSITKKFDIVIGPVSFFVYREYIAQMQGLKIINEAVRMFLDRPLDYTVTFVVKSLTIPLMRLGYDEDDNEMMLEAAQLGYTCWLGNVYSEEVETKIEAKRFRRI